MRHVEMNNVEMDGMASFHRSSADLSAENINAHTALRHYCSLTLNYCTEDRTELNGLEPTHKHYICWGMETTKQNLKFMKPAPGRASLILSSKKKEK